MVCRLCPDFFLPSVTWADILRFILVRLFILVVTWSVFSVSLQLRSALDRIEEMEATNSHLSKRLEKMKANRNALLAQQWRSNRQTVSASFYSACSTRRVELTELETIQTPRIWKDKMWQSISRSRRRWNRHICNVALWSGYHEHSCWQPFCLWAAERQEKSSKVIPSFVESEKFI